ncbi:36928_t:CDS:2, partial [Racocetra persica]
GKKKRKLVNATNISMPAIGIVANIQHLPLGFSTSQKSNQSNTSKCGSVTENITGEIQENITEEFIIEANEDDDNVIIIGSNEDTVLDSLLQKLKELQQ